MNRIENLFARADFSKETDLKDRLRAKLFSGEVQKNYESTPLFLDELEYVNAAGDPSVNNGETKENK